MKFLTCSRCFAGTAADPRRRQAQPKNEEITNPLVITKRPKVRHASKPQQPQKSKRFPEVLRGALASWRRRRGGGGGSHAPATSKNARRSDQKKPPPPPQRRRMPRSTAASRTQRLIRLYEDRASTPGQQDQLLILDPPPNFDDSLESHQNFRNKLNTLDFRRMNTVALEEQQPSTSTARSRKSLLLEDFIKERMRIEQAMIDLLNGTDRGSILLKTNDRRVRFDDSPPPPPPPKANIVELQEQAGETKKEAHQEYPKKSIETTEIKLSMDPNIKVEDFYVERKTTYLKGKTVEDKSLVLKLAPKDDIDRELEAKDGMARTQEIVFRNFGKLTF